MTHPDTPATAGTTIDLVTRELDGRVTDGIHVQLLWRPLDNQVSVAVNDTKAGEAFELEVRPGQRALDVFNHPYAYAAQVPALAGESAISDARCRS